jgi:hypothetical protein
MTRLLIKTGVTGLAAHIPDGLGRAMCHTQIKLGQWQIHYQSPEGMVICSNCRRAQEQAERASAADGGARRGFC